MSIVSDPLDSPGPAGFLAPDPLDGVPQGQILADDGATEKFDSLAIVRSGRSRGAPDSSVAYDDDLATSWPAGIVANRWIWFDLGSPALVRELRWLTTGVGVLTVDVSDDRKNWKEIDHASFNRGWSGFKTRDEAQFVRLSFSDDTSEDATLVEFAVYGVRIGRGAGGSPTVESVQERKQRANGRKDRRVKGERRSQQTAPETPSAEEDLRGETRDSGVQVSTKPGKTKCKGDRARCRATKGATRVEEDCAKEGTCVIDVRADGGTAICDSSGGDDNQTGQGEGKQPGRGGRCEATADGGTVNIGDVNP